MRQYQIGLNNKLLAQNIYQRAETLIEQYKTKAKTTTWMGDQAKILDKYIMSCMLAAEATIHCHILEDFSPKSRGSQHGKILEAGITSRSGMHTNGKNNYQLPKHGYHRSPQQTINPRQTTGMQRKLQASNRQRKGATTRIPTWKEPRLRQATATKC
jgi:hypothetical protein